MYQQIPRKDQKQQCLLKLSDFPILLWPSALKVFSWDEGTYEPVKLEPYLEIPEFIDFFGTWSLRPCEWSSCCRCDVLRVTVSGWLAWEEWADTRAALSFSSFALNLAAVSLMFQLSTGPSVESPCALSSSCSSEVLTVTGFSAAWFSWFLKLSALSLMFQGCAGA